MRGGGGEAEGPENVFKEINVRTFARIDSTCCNIYIYILQHVIYIYIKIFFLCSTKTQLSHILIVYPSIVANFVIYLEIRLCPHSLEHRTELIQNDNI